MHPTKKNLVRNSYPFSLHFYNGGFLFNILYAPDLLILSPDKIQYTLNHFRFPGFFFLNHFYTLIFQSSAFHGRSWRTRDDQTFPIKNAFILMKEAYRKVFFQCRKVIFQREKVFFQCRKPFFQREKVFFQYRKPFFQRGKPFFQHRRVFSQREKVFSQRRKVFFQWGKWKADLESKYYAATRAKQFLINQFLSINFKLI